MLIFSLNELSQSINFTRHNWCDCLQTLDWILIRNEFKFFSWVPVQIQKLRFERQITRFYKNKNCLYNLNQSLSSIMISKCNLYTNDNKISDNYIESSHLKINLYFWFVSILAFIIQWINSTLQNRLLKRIESNRRRKKMFIGHSISISK